MKNQIIDFFFLHTTETLVWFILWHMTQSYWVFKINIIQPWNSHSLCIRSILNWFQKQSDSWAADGKAEIVLCWLSWRFGPESVLEPCETDTLTERQGSAGASSAPLRVRVKGRAPWMSPPSLIHGIGNQWLTSKVQFQACRQRSNMLQRHNSVWEGRRCRVGRVRPPPGGPARRPGHQQSAR